MGKDAEASQGLLAAELDEETSMQRS